MIQQIAFTLALVNGLGTDPRLDGMCTCFPPPARTGVLLRCMVSEVQRLDFPETQSPKIPVVVLQDLSHERGTATLVGGKVRVLCYK